MATAKKTAAKTTKKTAKKAERRWGKWRYRPTARVLVHDEHPTYEVNVGRVKSAAGVLDWIVQISHKAQMFNAEDIGNLVLALDELLKLQDNYCANAMNE